MATQGTYLCPRLQTGKKKCSAFSMDWKQAEQDLFLSLIALEIHCYIWQQNYHTSFSTSSDLWCSSPDAERATMVQGEFSTLNIFKKK
jgi:hypothetical protein